MSNIYADNFNSTTNVVGNSIIGVDTGGVGWLNGNRVWSKNTYTGTEPKIVQGTPSSNKLIGGFSVTTGTPGIVGRFFGNLPDPDGIPTISTSFQARFKESPSSGTKYRIYLGASSLNYGGDGTPYIEIRNTGQIFLGEFGAGSQLQSLGNMDLTTFGMSTFSLSLEADKIKASAINPNTGIKTSAELSREFLSRKVFSFQIQFDGDTASAFELDNILATTVVLNDTCFPVLGSGLTTTRTVSGSINPNGIASNYRFEYGTSPTLETYTPTTIQTLTAASTPQTVQAILSGLSLETTYYYRLVAIKSTNPTDTNRIEGIICSFTMPDAPDVPIINETCLTPENVTYKSATIKKTVNPNGYETTCHFGYSKTPGGVYTLTAEQTIPTGTSNVTISADIAGLEGDTNYYYKFFAQNSQGSSESIECGFLKTLPQPLPEVELTSDTTVACVGGIATANINITVTPHDRPTQAFVVWDIDTPQQNEILIGSNNGSELEYGYNANVEIGAGETVKYKIKVGYLGGYVETEEFTITAPITICASSVTTEMLLPATVINADGVDTAENLLDNDGNCACASTVKTITLGDFGISETEIIEVTGIKAEIIAIGDKTTSRVRVYAYDSAVSNESFLILDKNIIDGTELYEQTVISSFSNVFNNLNALNNIKIKVEMTDVCVDYAAISVTYKRVKDTCDVIPETCCGLPTDFPPFTLAESIDSDSEYVLISDFKLKLDNGETENIETLLQDSDCGLQFIINKGTRERGFEKSEVIEVSDLYRITSGVVRGRVTRRGIAQYSPFQSANKYKKEHQTGDPIELWYGASWQASRQVFNCGGGAENCSTNRLSYCGNVPAPTPNDKNYVLWADIKDLLSGELPIINGATETEAGLVLSATPTQVVKRTLGVGYPRVLTTTNTGSVYYVGIASITNSDANNIVATTVANFTELSCGIRGTLTPTQTNTQAVTLTLNGVQLALTRNGGDAIPAGYIVQGKTIDFVYNCVSNTFEVISGLKEYDTNSSTQKLITYGATAGGTAWTGILKDVNGLNVLDISNGFEIHYTAPANSAGNETLSINSTTAYPIVTDLVGTPIKAKELLVSRLYEMVLYVNTLGQGFWIVSNPDIIQADNSYQTSAEFKDNQEKNIIWISTGGGNGSFPISSFNLTTPSVPLGTNKKWALYIKAGFSMEVSGPTNRARITLNCLVNTGSSQYVVYDNWDNFIDQADTTTVFSRSKYCQEDYLDVNQTAGGVTSVSLRAFITTSNVPDPNTWATNQKIKQLEDGRPAVFLKYAFKQVNI